MTRSYNQLRQELVTKLEDLGLDSEVQYIIENLSTIDNPRDVLAKVLDKPSMSTASLRAPEGYHLPNIMMSLEPDLLQKFGGHPCAAGFSTQTTKLGAVKQGFVDYLSHNNQGAMDMSSYQSQIPTSLLERMPEKLRASLDKNVIYLDYTDLDLDLLVGVFGLEPFGIDFPFPYFLFEVPSSCLTSRKVLGQDRKHIKLTMNNGLNVTFFNLELELINELIRTDASLIILAKLSQNTWNNSTRLELIGEGIGIG